MNKIRNELSPEIREFAIRMVGNHRAVYGSETGGDDFDCLDVRPYDRDAAALVPSERFRRTSSSWTGGWLGVMERRVKDHNELHRRCCLSELLAT